MPNPDSTVPGVNTGAIGVLGLFVGVIVIILFNYQYISFFSAILYFALPLFIYALMFVVIYISKPGVTAGNAFISALPTVGTTYIALFISYISYLRIPIASVVAPLFVGSPPAEEQATQQGGRRKQIKRGGGCGCSTPSYSLEEVELQYPSVKGISYAFYLFFAIYIGGISGLSLPSV